MGFIVLLILLSFFAWLAVLIDRRIQVRKQASQAATEAKLDQAWRAPWRRADKKATVNAFRAWAIITFADQSALQHWLATLSDESIQLLTVKLTAFCTDLGFEFAWLLERKIDQEVMLAPRLQAIAVQYIEACYQAYLVQADVKAFQTWQDFTQHPYRQDQQALAQRLLVQLLDQGLTPAAAQSLLTAPEKEREVYVVQAVREAAEKHPAAFRTVLKAVVTRHNEPAPSPERIRDRLKHAWFRRPAQEGQPTSTEL